ncbi:MAG: PD-(D/E)XK nuclease family protein [Ignavibacteriales bacterium]|nr:PD-(D/E)XK nuclease family protein [Ignavibacteriales bacterium]
MIDKIIFLGEKIIIIDYKTDNVNEENIPAKSEHYLNQLKFYFYIVSGLYKNINDFELRLIFLKQPDKKFLIELKQKDRLKFGVELKKTLSAVQLKSYYKERNHCLNCNYSNGQQQCIHD